MKVTTRQGAGWFKCDWKDPSDGGKVQVYKILRRVELEYLVVGVNKAGESEPSNSITITL